MAEGWFVALVHGRGIEDVETFSTLYAAMEWARLKGAEYHSDGADCLGQMQRRFVLEPSGGVWFQYGTDYHWVTFEKITKED